MGLCFWKGSPREMALTSDSLLVSFLPKTLARKFPSPCWQASLSIHGDFSLFLCKSQTCNLPQSISKGRTPRLGISTLTAACSFPNEEESFSQAEFHNLLGCLQLVPQL